MNSMARDKATITLDRVKAAEAMELVDGRSISDTVDIALGRLIRAERLRRDLAAYTSEPMTEPELALAELPVRFDLGDEDVDYDAIYGTEQ